jgi:hypothetical protein
MRSWNKAQAREFLCVTHFDVPSIEAYFHRLGSVQYDPLKPFGRNIDLVFQSRVPGYHVDDWEIEVYDVESRRYYDAWDKQACVVPVTDWPLRRHYHRWHAPRWRRQVLEPYARAVERVERSLADRGPSTGDDLADLELPGAENREARRGSWYGPRLINHVLKALWYTGRAVTHHRSNGRHVYSKPELVIPREQLHAAEIDEREALAELVVRRHRAVGLLRPNATGSVWSVPLNAAGRKALIAELVDEGRLVPIDVEGTIFHTTPEDLDRFDTDVPHPSAADAPGAAGSVNRGAARVREAKSRSFVRFIAPLDSLLWDRTGAQYLYNFDYRWEVYKPVAQRRYGYYVLPVMYGSQLVGRIDSRIEDGAWDITNAWWEPPWAPKRRRRGENAYRSADEALNDALDEAVAGFRDYLRPSGPPGPATSH